jgi:hypothetical protein
MPYGDLLADVVQGSTANTPPVFKDGNGTTIGTLCRAWVNFNGTGTVAIRASFNVSSITDNGTGTYTVNITNAMPDVNFSVVVSTAGSAAAGGNADGNRFINASILTSSTVRLVQRDISNSLEDAPQAFFAVFR